MLRRQMTPRWRQLSGGFRAGWFHKFEVDFGYPLEGGFVVVSLDLILTRCCAVLLDG